MKDSILNKINKKKLEDIELLTEIEKILLKKRGYIFKIPKPGTPVVSLMSGGMDTTIVTALLLDKYKLNVYPVHYYRHHLHSENVLKSVLYFSKLFKQKYPSLFHDPKIMKLEYPSPTIIDLVYTVDQKIIDKKTGQKLGIPFQPSVYMYNIIQYIYTLKPPLDKKMRTIFAATLSGNIDLFAYESLTSYRSLMLEVCTMLKDFSWQITSFPIEKEIGFYMKKSDLIKYASYLNLPLPETFTCQGDYKYQCGECDVCFARKDGFAKADLVDNTIYESNRKDIIGKIKRKNYRLKRLLKWA